MNLSNNSLLMLGGIASFLVALLHIFLAIAPQAYRYFGADELADLAEQGSSFTVLVTIGLAVMFAVWGLYALAGAGWIRPLPWLQSVLIAIGVIYVLRGLMLPFDVVKYLNGARAFRFILLSTGSFSTGLLYLVGSLVR